MQADNSDEHVRATPAGACAECGAAYAHDQRYCLECGAALFASEAVTTSIPAIAAGVASSPLESPLAGAPPQGSPGIAAPETTVQREPPLPSAAAHGGGSALTVITGVGVLLLAIGVGVLIGRSGASTPSVSTTPQVITVPATTTSTTAAEVTGTTASDGPSATTGKKSTGSSSKGDGKGAKAESTVGSQAKRSESEAALKHLKEKSGKESYEQKSNSLPNVVETP